jgi:hypothetical protein
MVLRNIDILRQNYTASQPRILRLYFIMVCTKLSRMDIELNLDVLNKWNSEQKHSNPSVTSMASKTKSLVRIHLYRKAILIPHWPCSFIPNKTLFSEASRTIYHTSLIQKTCFVAFPENVTVLTKYQVQMTEADEIHISYTAFLTSHL